MNEITPLICIVDDDDLHSGAVADILSSEGFQVTVFPSAIEFLKHPQAFKTYDLVISDINMPVERGLRHYWRNRL